MKQGISSKTLGIVCGMYGYCYGGALYLHLSYGRIVDELAERFDKIVLCTPILNSKPDHSRDYIIKADNVEIVNQPFYTNAITSLKHFWGISKAYRYVCKRADVLFFRGMPAYVGMLYFWSWFYSNPPCHWIVGNPVKLLMTHKRVGFLMDSLSILYALQDRFFTKLGRWFSDGAFVCNGEELGKLYKSPRTVVTVSTTITKDEFYEREDTCHGDLIKILFIGFIRPEKGVEYLIEAMSKLIMEKNWELILAGPSDQYSKYRKKLNELIESAGIWHKIKWPGYVSYGPEMFKYLRDADIFVLPTLSEGTPRVLVEARANSLPIIATNVGGIPTSVTDGFDGLLVPPKDPVALARAIQRVVEDGELRRSLIANGLKTAREMTVDHFAELVFHMMEN